METYVNQRFVVYAVTGGLCQRWDEVTNQARVLGRPINAADAWGAATAIGAGASLLTYNRKNLDYLPSLEAFLVSQVRLSASSEYSIALLCIVTATLADQREIFRRVRLAERDGHQLQVHPSSPPAIGDVTALP